MYRGINVWNSKILYHFKQNNLTCIVCEGGCFNNKECEFKVNVLVGIL